jgi:glutathione S-transferase
MLKRNQHREWLTKNDSNELEALRRTAVYQSASIQADIAIALTFLEIARIDGKGRDAAKEEAERTVEAVHRLLPLIEDLLKTADRKWIRTSLAELESALAKFDFPQAPES